MGIIHCIGARQRRSPFTACCRKYTPFAWPCPASHLSDVADFAAVVGDIEIPHVVAVEQQAPRGRVVEAQKELMPSCKTISPKLTRLHDRPVSETVPTVGGKAVAGDDAKATRATHLG